MAPDRRPEATLARALAERRVLVVCGAGGVGKTTRWDFTNAVKYWTTDGHENHGFMMYCAGKYVDYLYVHSRENPKVENRPVVMVIYEPKP